MLFIANDPIYYSHPDVIKNYIIDSLFKGGSLASFPEWYCKPNYLKEDFLVLLDSIDTGELKRITSTLMADVLDKNSLLAVLVIQELCAPLTKKTRLLVKPRKISLKKYAREKRVFGLFYKFLSDI